MKVFEVDDQMSLIEVTNDVSVDPKCPRFFQPKYYIGQVLYAPRVYKRYGTQKITVNGKVYTSQEDYVLEIVVKTKTITRIDITITSTGIETFYGSEDWFRHPESYFDAMYSNKEEAEKVAKLHFDKGEEFYG